MVLLHMARSASLGDYDGMTRFMHVGGSLCVTRLSALGDLPVMTRLCCLSYLSSGDSFLPNGRL